MDKAVEPEVQASIDRTLARFAESSVRFDDMVTRRAGSRRFLDVHMHVPASWTLGRAAALRGEVEQALMGEIAGLRASIQLLPSNVEPQFQRCPGIAVIALVQRVAEARVAIGDRVVGAIGRGAAAVRVRRARRHARRSPTGSIAKVLGLRIFADDAGKMNLDLAAVGGGLLVVSQFTLAADTSRGNRPGFSGAARRRARPPALRARAGDGAPAARRRRQRRVRRRHAGQPRQRRAGDDPDHAARLSAPAPPLSRRTGRPP